MVFSSLIFVFYFLPIVILLYYLAKDKYRNYILLIASLFFYSYGEPQFVFVMVGLIIINYLAALFIDRNKNKRRKVILVLAVLCNIAVLYVFKYLNFTFNVVNEAFDSNFKIMEIALPIGVSFFTFQAMSYVIDVYNGRVYVQKNPLFVALYISFFPQLIAGPIVRYSSIESQINDRKSSFESFSDGSRRFMLGFAKKVLLANNLALVVKDTFACDATAANTVYLWIGAICFSLQIFFDFSGYSDMAIGLGKMFGFNFEENFNYPYISKSITEFWRRWHISLSSWFKDYVYIPLGGSRVTIFRNVFNLLIVWLLTGIWHGANYTFIVWGLIYWFLLIIEKFLIKPFDRRPLIIAVLWRIATLLCINFNWVIFNSPNLKYGIKYCLSMIGYYDNPIVIDTNIVFIIREYGIFIILGLFFSTPVMKVICSKVKETKASTALSIVEPIVYVALFLWSVSYLILGAHNPFIYFNF